MIIPNHPHFLIVAFDKKDEKGIMQNATQVEIIDCDNETEALERTKQLCPRNGYYIQKIWQCSHCLDHINQGHFQREVLKSQKQIAKALEKHME